MEIVSSMKKPKAATCAAAGVVIIALLAIFIELKPEGRPSAPVKAFYTVDDGATYFTESISNAPPFDHNGLPAVRAIVIVGANGKTFVASLLRFSPKKKAELDAMISKNPESPEVRGMRISGMDEIKTPRSAKAKWTPVASTAGNAIATFQTPPEVTQPTQVLEP